MKYVLEITIDAPRQQVVELFDNSENLFEWQDGLKSFEHLEGEPGTVGAKSRIIYDVTGKGKLVEMIETITHKNLPDEFFATFESDGVWNQVENRFLDAPENKTTWQFNSEFRCSGLMRVIAFLMPFVFKKQSIKFMNDFKAFVGRRCE